MKKVLLWERKCPVTLDPLTIFSFLVVHSKLTWNRNYCKCISLTQEKNKATISIFSKSSEAQSPPGWQCACAEKSLAALTPTSVSGQAIPGRDRALSDISWGLRSTYIPLSMSADHFSKASCLVHSCISLMCLGLNWQCWCHYAGMDWCSYSDILLLRSWVRRFNCICQLQ